MGSNLHLKPHTLRRDQLDEVKVPEVPQLDGKAFPNTKLVFTIGPASKSVEVLSTILKAGVTCARFDFTWGTLDFHLEALENLKKATQLTGKQCAVMVDTQGREVYVTSGEIRVDETGWPWVVEQYVVKKDDEVLIVPGSKFKPIEGKVVLGCNNERYYEQQQPGDTIYLGRYLVTGIDVASLYLKVEKTEGDVIVCKAENDAELSGLITMFHVERRKYTVENIQNQSPVLCQKDRDWMKEFAKSHPLDIVSLSYCRQSKDIEDTHQYLISIGQDNAQVFSKLETKQSLYNFKQILSLSDGIVISRGNLGLDILPEKIAVVQKHIITYCNMMAKPVILTRIVDTMVLAPRPTRAEATDVSNAILDGVDGLLLGAETVRGQYPVETVLTVISSCRAAEKVFDDSKHFEYLMQEALKLEEGQRYLQNEMGVSNVKDNLSTQIAAMAIDADPGKNALIQKSYDKRPQQLSTMESIASSAVRAAEKVKASLIVVFSQSGVTARYVAKYRPSVPIISLVIPSVKINKRMKWELSGAQTARQALIIRGLMPKLASPHPDGEQLLDQTLNEAMMQGLIQTGDNIITLQKTRDELTIKIAQVGQYGEGVRKLKRGMSRKTASQLDLDHEQDGNDNRYIFHTLSEIQTQAIDIDKLREDYEQKQANLNAR